MSRSQALSLALSAHRRRHLYNWLRSRLSHMNPRMSCQFVGSGESLVAAWMCACMRFLAGVCPDVSGLAETRENQMIDFSQRN